MLSLLYGPTLTSRHDYWKNQSLTWIKLSSELCPFSETFPEAPITSSLFQVDPRTLIVNRHLRKVKQPNVSFEAESTSVASAAIQGEQWKQGLAVPIVPTGSTPP